MIVQDEAVAPPFALAVKNVSASLAGLSTDGRSTATFVSRGLIEKAPFHVAGGVRASSSSVWADMTLKADGIQLPVFSPYSVQVIGYKLDRGTLSLDLTEALAGWLCPNPMNSYSAGYSNTKLRRGPNERIVCPST